MGHRLPIPTARSQTALAELDRLPNVHPVALDITDRAEVAALGSQLPDRLDGVVNNAGIFVNGPIEAIAIDDLVHQLDVNVVAQIAVTQVVLPRIRDTHGRVVFISSTSGLYTTPGTGAYNASEYAIEALGDALRMELRPWKIPVSLVEPGPIRMDRWGDGEHALTARRPKRRYFLDLSSRVQKAFTGLAPAALADAVLAAATTAKVDTP
jgi:NADP-dependent 3-hydroxy acid dehydrogenase YdfG